MDTGEPEALDPLHYSPVDVNWGVLSPPFPLVLDRLLCPADVVGEVFVSDLLLIGCLMCIFFDSTFNLPCRLLFGSREVVKQAV